MNTDTIECGKNCCRGPAPFFICQDKTCLCHWHAQAAAIRAGRLRTYRDPTAGEAINRATRSTR